MTQASRISILPITGMHKCPGEAAQRRSADREEKTVHEQGLVSVLKQIHDDLDAAVFDAYGWPHDLTDEQILERLVALNAERAEEEKRGIIRWLRPEFQNPAGAAAPTAQQSDLPSPLPAGEGSGVRAPEKKPWPKDLPQQVAAVRDLITTAGPSPQPPPPNPSPAPKQKTSNEYWNRLLPWAWRSLSKDPRPRRGVRRRQTLIRVFAEMC